MDASERKIASARQWLREVTEIALSNGQDGARFRQGLNELSGALDYLDILLEENRLQNEQIVLDQLEIEKQREWYADVFNFAPDGYAVTDLNGRFQEVNESAAAMLNIPWGGVNAAPLVAYVAQADRGTILEILSQFRSGRLKRRDDVQVTLVPRKKPPVPVALTVAPAYDVDKKAVGLRWMLHDVTERRKAEEELDQYRQTLEELVRERTEELRATVAELERSNKDLEQLAYVASHDLREPLRQITGYIGLLEKRYHHVFDKDAREFMGFVTDGAKRMDALILDLLAYSRVGKQATSFVEVDLAEAAKEGVHNISTLVQETGTVLHVGELPKVKGSAMLLSRVFQNLIENAIKYRKEDVLPVIDVESRRNDSEWLIRVRDNGIGFAPEQAERIFQLFQRLHRDDSQGGTGIGLSICRRVVELHGGHMWAESQPGKGATFCFTLPAPPIGLNGNETGR